MRYRFAVVIAAAALAVLAEGARADTAGVTVSSVNLRSGPSTGYAVVTVVPGGAHLTMLGCTADSNWCSVSWGGVSGWVSAGYVQVTYQGQPRPVTAGTIAMVGLGVIAVSSIDWDDDDHDHHHDHGPYGVHRNHWSGDDGAAHAGRTACGPNGCAHAGVTRRPNGDVVVRRRAIID